jgi:hydrogenase expression/formation protein HypD
MKYLDEFRDPDIARKIVSEIHSVTKQNWTIMEICGGQTHSIMKHGIDQLIPDKIELVHGPGCPVCVTPLEKIDKAIIIASRDDVIFTSFGDMLRVPGSKKDLFKVKSEGGDVRMVYSPLDALQIARDNPDKKVVFFAVGFETTVPLTAMAVYQAKEQNIKNFSLLVSHVLVPPAITALQSSPQNRVQGFLAAGHVCTVMGLKEYEPLSEKYNIPIVATGFEPVDILEGILMVVRQLEEGRAEVENQYTRVVKREGNRPAMDVIAKVFDISDQKWRGIGTIPESGMVLKPEMDAWNAEKIFDIEEIEVDEPEECISGVILQGLKKPHECPAFGTKCTPSNPLGATMVSSEGACAAYYNYHRRSEVK